MVEAAGQWFRVFQRGLDYAFIASEVAGMRGVLPVAFFASGPSARSVKKPSASL